MTVGSLLVGNQGQIEQVASKGIHPKAASPRFQALGGATDPPGCGLAKGGRDREIACTR